MVHPTTQFSPYEVMFGRPMRGPLDLQRGLPPHLLQAEINPTNYPHWLRNVLNKIHEEVRQYSKDSALRMKSYYDIHSTVNPYKKNDLVWFYNRKRIKGRNPKLDTPWEGPYKIVKIINDCVACIQMTTAPFIRRIVHLDKLAAYGINQDPLQSAWLSISMATCT
jgi:hypothetical protein